MRWEELFADLEAQLLAADAAELAGEVTDRTRREAGLLRLTDRLRPVVGRPVGILVEGAGSVQGRLLDVGEGWLLLQERGQRQVLVPTVGVLGITGLGSPSAVPGSEGEVGRRLDLRWAQRARRRPRPGRRRPRRARRAPPRGGTSSGFGAPGQAGTAAGGGAGAQQLTPVAEQVQARSNGR